MNMKVLFVTYPAFPLEIGGFQNQVREIYAGLIERGVEVEWYHIEDIDIEKYDIVQIFSSDASLLPIARKAKDLGKQVVLTPIIGSRQLPNWYYKLGLILSKIPQLFFQ